ncbi:MAG: DcuS/MalK family sensor histidine kinase [Negativicutes bacterium]
MKIFYSRLPHSSRSELHKPFDVGNASASAKKSLTLETKIILLVWSVVALSLFVTYFLIASKVNDIVEELMGKNAARIAQILAKSPAVIASLSDDKQMLEIENWAALLGDVSKADFIVYDVKGNIRYRSSKAPLDSGSLQPLESLSVEPPNYVHVQQGPQGYFLQAVSPILSAGSTQIGTIAVGISVDSAAEALGESRFFMIFSSYFGLVLGIVGALFLAKNIKQTLFGLEPFAIARLLEERNAMLQSVREGIVAIDNTGRVTLVNEEALRLLDMEGKRDKLLYQPIEQVIPRTRLLDVLQSKNAEYDQEELLNGVAVVMNRVPVSVDDRTVAAIATFRDRSEIKRMAEELTGVRTYVEALRSQTHEFMNKLHVILGLVRLKAYDELAPYIARIASEQDAVTDFVAQHIKDPVLAGFWIGKLSRARELGVQLSLCSDSFVPRLDNIDFTNDLVTIIGNLVDNAMEALLDNSRRHVEVLLLYDEGYVQIEVQDTGPGISPELRDSIFEKGFSTKARDRGFGLALIRKILDRREGTVSFDSLLQLGTTFRIAIPYEGVKKGT